VLMIEKRQAIDNLEAILEVPGIDMVQFGPSDYAMSIGLAGQGNHPRVREAERYMIETARARGIPARAEIRDASSAQPYLDMGVRHFCVGWDVRVLHDWFTQQGQAMQQLLAGTAAPASKAAPSSSGYN
jgi:2-keto-3-deoxy-L-rhamnonate aldolase RhmA